MKFKLLLSLLFIFQAHASYENELTEFTTDGCSVIPDLEMTECCIEHDVAYWAGGTWEEKDKADEELKQCVESKSNALLGSMFYWGVYFGGSAERTTGYHWGYGWKYKKGYEPLTAEEVQLAKDMLPADYLNTPVTELVIKTKPIPTISGNYCIDEISNYLTEYYGDSHFKIEKMIERVKHYDTEVIVKTDASDDRFHFYYRSNNWKKCEMPRYNKRNKNLYRKVLLK